MVSEFGSIRSYAIEEYAASLPRAVRDTTQLTRGKLYGKTDLLANAEMVICRTATSQTVKLRGKLSHHFIGISLHADTECMYNCGYSYQPGEISLLYPGGDFEIINHAHTSLLTLHIKPEILHHHLPQNSIISSDTVVGENGSIKLAVGDHLAPLIQIINKQLERLESSGAKGLPGEESNEFTAAIYQAFSSAIQHATLVTLRQNARTKLISRALDAVSQLPLNTLNVESLAQIAGTTKRNLQMTFQDSLGITPKEFITNLRLNAVRQQLLTIDMRKTTIAEQAVKFGFLHMGNFSKTYSLMFGELPSQTSDISAATTHTQPV